MKRDIGENNYLGWMFTDRRDREGSNTVGGMDGSFWLKPTLNVKGFFTRSQTSGEGGEGNSYSAMVDYSSDLVGASLQHLTVEPEAQADLGFITRTDIRQTGARFRLSPRPGRWGIRVVDIRSDAEYISTTDGRMQDWEAGVYLGPEFESGDGIGLKIGFGESRLDEAFQLADSITIDADLYDAAGRLHGTLSARVGEKSTPLEYLSEAAASTGTLWLVLQPRGGARNVGGSYKLAVKRKIAKANKIAIDPNATTKVIRAIVSEKIADDWRPSWLKF